MDNNDVLARPDGTPRTPKEFLEEEEWANAKQAARILGISRATYYRLLPSLTSKRVSSRKVLVSTDSLKANTSN